MHLGPTILCEIGDIDRFPSAKDFHSYGRLVKGTVASAGKIKGLAACLFSPKQAPGHPESALPEE